MAESVPKKSSGLRRKASLKVVFAVKKKSRNPTYLKVYKILQKSEKDRSKEENELLSSSASIVNQVLTRLEKRQQILAREKEFEDCAQLLEEKCAKLAIAIAGAKHLVVYSGAGVSTAAKIPDYRGTNGIWTRLQQGKDIGDHDLSIAEPTTAHMALYSLYKNSLLKYIVSQNCDGLHLRSGLPRRVLSEVHGNMNLEVCEMCNIQYWRAFDVTTHTARYAHQTARRCSGCTCPLRDTIVHFGERGSLAWPINWAGACHAAKQADMILCIGSSLKVLKRYPWLWGMDKPVSKRPKLYIVNLQWTPKDFQATLKINGDRAIGKTSIVNMFVSDGREYPKNYTMTFAAEISVKSVHIPNTTDAVELIIYDCPGIDLYSDLLNNFWNGPDLLMVVFDVTNKKSLDSVGHWVSLAKKAKWRGSNGSPITSILLGNKTDLQDRLVCKEADAVQIADRLNMKCFFGSARNNQGLEDPFQFLADSFYKHSLKNYS